MGIDLLDLRFGLEREFGVEISESRFLSELRSLEQTHGDSDYDEASQPVLTVRQLFNIIVVSIECLGGTVPADAWDIYVSCISDTLGVKREEVISDACLIRDLGMS